MRVGVVYVAFEALATQNNHEAVLLDRLDEHLDAGDLHLTEANGDRTALLGRDASRAAVADVAVGVEGAEVAADGHVTGLEIEADACGFEGAAADEELHGVVAEEAEVPGGRCRG